MAIKNEFQKLQSSVTLLVIPNYKVWHSVALIKFILKLYKDYVVLQLKIKYLKISLMLIEC